MAHGVCGCVCVCVGGGGGGGVMGDREQVLSYFFC